MNPVFFSLWARPFLRTGTHFIDSEVHLSESGLLNFSGHVGRSKQKLLQKEAEMETVLARTPSEVTELSYLENL